MPWYQIQDLMVTAGIILAVLIPVTGLTLRFGVWPFIRDFREPRGTRKVPAAPDTDRRLDRVEQQLEHLEYSINRLLEASEFDRQLKSGKSSEENR